MPKCKCCKEKFEPKFFLQKFCMDKSECISAHLEYAKEQKQKAWNKKKKVIKESLKTHKDYLKEAQIEFNTFIRLRDKDKPCISCGNLLTGKFDAGHFYSVGSTPELRFNEDNVHGQCVFCNRHKHGNLIEYSENLPKRISQESFEQLKQLKGVLRKYSIEELKQIKALYKEKAKALSKQ